MKEEEKSKFWRAMGDSVAYDDGAWEFRARTFAFSARRMKELSTEALNSVSEDLILIAPAEFMISLAIELIAKACYLKHKIGPREKIYTHDMSELGLAASLSDEQKRILNHSEQYVIWAGRYPTPKWTKEKFKADFDVPVESLNGVHKIKVSELPNSACPNRIEEKFSLYNHIHKLWSDEQMKVQPGAGGNG